MERSVHTVPLYDLLDGLGRRRRLRRAGYDPNLQVNIPARDQEQRETQTEQEAEAAA